MNKWLLIICLCCWPDAANGFQVTLGGPLTAATGTTGDLNGGMMFHPLGVAEGYQYDGTNVTDAFSMLGVGPIHVGVWWHEIEAVQGVYDFTLLDAFIAQFPRSQELGVRIWPRRNAWGTSDGSKTIPNDLTIGGTYYEFVRRTVLRFGQRNLSVWMTWEADCNPAHWTGTAPEYADMARTFYAAVKAANARAKVVLAVAFGDIKPCKLKTQNVLSLLSTDNPVPFDAFNMHLYHHQQYLEDPNYYSMYTIPGRLGWYRKELYQYPAFRGIPIVVSEYGGPSATEASYLNQTLFSDLATDVTGSPCILSTDCTVSPSHPAPEVYPDEFRMFCYGIDATLEARRDRIHGRQIVQRTIMALGAGASRLYWWRLKQPPPIVCGIDEQFVHPFYGKMALFTRDGVPRYAQPIFTRLAGYLSDLAWISKIELPNPSLYYYRLVSTSNVSRYVLWERRDEFFGETLPATAVSVPVPWATAQMISSATGTVTSLTVVGGNAAVNITDTPVFLEE